MTKSAVLTALALAGALAFLGSCSLFEGDESGISILSPSDGGAYTFRCLVTNRESATYPGGTIAFADIVTNQVYRITVSGAARRGTNSSSSETLTVDGSDGSQKSYTLVPDIFGNWSEDVALDCAYNQTIDYDLTAEIISAMVRWYSVTNIPNPFSTNIVEYSVTNVSTNTAASRFSVAYVL